MHHNVVPEHPNQGVSRDLAVLDHAAGDGADGGDLVGHAHLGMADDHFLVLGSQHTLHGGLNFVHGIVDHPVEPHIHVCPVAGGLGGGVGANVEAHDDGAGGRGQQDIAFVDGADARMDDPNPDFLVAQLLQGGLHGLGRALNVGLDDQRQLLHFALLHLGEEVVEGHLLLKLGGGVLLCLTALLHQLPGHPLIGNGVELVAGGGHVGKAGDLHRHGGAGGLDGTTLVVGHHPDTTHGGTGNDDIALIQSAVLHQKGGHRAPGLIQTSLDDGALGPAVGVGLQLLNLGGEQHHFQQLVQTLTGLGGDGHDDGIAAPLLGHQVILGQLLLDLIGVGGRLIHLVDGNDNRHIRRLGVVDGLHGLGHDAVVGGHHQNGDIRGLCAAGTHGGKGRVAGSIQEGDHLALHVHGVSADVLGNAAGLPRGDGGLPDGIQGRGLAVVNVTHDNDNRGTVLELLGGIHMVVDDLLLDGNGDFLLHLAAHFGGHKFGGVEVDGLVDTGHDPVLHQALDDLARSLLHPGGQLAHGDLVGDLHGQGSLPSHLHLETAHLLLLLVAALAAPEGALLLLILLLALAAADALLAALVVLNPLGDQVIHIGEPVGIDLHRGGIHHPAFPLALRLLGLFGLGCRLLGRGRLRLGGILGAGVVVIVIIGLCLGLRRLGSLLLRLGLRLLLGGGGLHGKHLL